MPLYVARALSAAAGLCWLFETILDASNIMASADKEYSNLCLKIAATIWCMVSCYLSFSFTDGLMLRWLFSYGPNATLVRLVTLNAFNYYLTTTILNLAKAHHSSALLGWILVALILTIAYCVQDWLTSNISIITDGNQRRRVNFLEVAVFCVVPVGLASFFTMIILLFLRTTYGIDH